MAAGIVANEEQLDSHKIDRSGVVSKYVGETEKRLNKIFLKACPDNLMLFFDGADVLLGKRSTVKDARDRYVNSEISYLLQSLEEDEGIGILTTNLKETMGDACLRQRHPLVDFLFPGETCGHLIWARMGGNGGFTRWFVCWYGL